MILILIKTFISTHVIFCVTFQLVRGSHNHNQHSKSGGFSLLFSFRVGFYHFESSFQISLYLIHRIILAKELYRIESNLRREGNEGINFLALSHKFHMINFSLFLRFQVVY